MQCVLSASRDITARDAPRSVRDVRKRVLKFLPLARACGAAEVFAIDIDPAKLETAEAYGARPIDPALGDPGRQIHDLTHGRGVDMALEFAGIPATQAQAVASLAVQSYPTLINRQAEIVRVSDHLPWMPIRSTAASTRWLDFAAGHAPLS